MVTAQPKLRLIKVQGLPDVTAVAFKPDPGKVWDVIDLWAWHTSTATQNCNWLYTDGANQIQRFTVGEGANTFIQFCTGGIVGAYYLNEMLGPLTFNDNLWAFFSTDALSTGKAITVAGVVWEYNLQDYPKMTGVISS
jgi:hypothetical protein